MLSFFRNNIKKFAFVFWIAVIAFVVGGAYLFVRGPFTMGSNTAIKVGDIKISFPEYEKTYNNIYRFYVQLLTQIKGGKVTDADIKKLNIKQKTIDTLIERALLLQEAKKEGIKVTDQDVERKIESNKAFYVNGHFSKAKYLALLRENNINPRDYEESVRVSLYIDKLKQKILKNVKVTPEEIKKYFMENYAKIDLDYVYIPLDQIEKKIKPTKKELEAFYEKHKEMFRVPTQLKFKYILVGLNYAESQIKISDNESKRFYKQHISYFIVPKRIKVAQILIQKKDNETDAQLKKRAMMVYNLIKNKKLTFKEAAKKYSDDMYTKNKGGELGYVTKNMVVPGFWNGIKNLKVGELSKPFKSKFGYHIAIVEDVKQPFTRKYKDVKKEIVSYLKAQKAREDLFIYAKKVFVKIRDAHGDMDKVAKKLSLKVKTTGFMSLDKPKPPFTRAIVRNALMSQKGKLLGPDQGIGGYLIYEIVQKKPSYIPPFNKIEKKVEKAYIQFKARQMAEELAKKIEDQLKAGKTLKQAAKKFSLKVEIAKDIGKFQPDEKMACTLKDSFMKTIFTHKTGYFGICSTDKGFYVYVIANKKFDKKEFEKVKKSIQEQLKSQKEYEAMQKFINQLKKKVKIEINPKL